MLVVVAMVFVCGNLKKLQVREWKLETGHKTTIFACQHAHDARASLWPILFSWPPPPPKFTDMRTCAQIACGRARLGAASADLARELRRHSNIQRKAGLVGSE